MVMGTKFVRRGTTLSDVFPLFNRTFAIWTKRRIFPLSFGGRSRAVTDRFLSDAAVVSRTALSETVSSGSQSSDAVPRSIARTIYPS